MTTLNIENRLGIGDGGNKNQQQTTANEMHTLFNQLDPLRAFLRRRRFNLDIPLEIALKKKKRPIC